MGSLSILYYVSSFPKLSESFILNEISELHSRDHNVAVFALNDPGEDIKHKEYDDFNIPIYYVNISYTDLIQLLSKKPAQMGLHHATDGFFRHFSLKYISYNLLLARQCAEFIDSLDFEVDIVHAHFASPTRIGGMFAAQYHDIPCTVTAHAFEIFKSPNVTQIRYICDGVDHVIVPSEYNKKYLRNKIGIENDMTIVPATTRIEKFKPSADTIEHRLLTVARLVEKKGHQYGIEAVKALVEQGYDVEYHIIGTGERKEMLQQQVHEYGIEDHVEFLGHVSDERLQRELSEAAVFVLPCIIAEDGDRDAMPVVLKEAMAAETACVSTTVSAIPELITDGRDGLLVPERDSEKLAEAIKELLDNLDQRKRIAKNGRQKVHDKFDISESIDTLAGVFESLHTNGEHCLDG